MRRTLSLLTLVLGLIIIPPVWAHANLLRSDPPANAALSSETTSTAARLARTPSRRGLRTGCV